MYERLNLQCAVFMWDLAGISALGLETVEDWNADSHLPRYLKAEVVPTDSQYTRFQFLRKYTSATTHVWNWFTALPPDQQRRYRRFVLPLANGVGGRDHFQI